MSDEWVGCYDSSLFLTGYLRNRGHIEFSKLWAYQARSYLVKAIVYFSKIQFAYDICKCITSFTTVIVQKNLKQCLSHQASKLKIKINNIIG